MQQLTFRGPGRLEWEDVPAPELSGAGDALVRPIAVATCDLDTQVILGRAPCPGPFAFGHEFVADVLDVAPDVTVARPGDRVIVPFQISCGVCERCRRGLTGSCTTAGAGAAFGMAPIARQEWGGAFSDVVRVPYADAMLVPLPAGLDPAAVASVSDNVPDGWRAVAEPFRERPGSPVLVVGGAGDVALYAVAVATALGSERVTYVDTNRAPARDRGAARCRRRRPRARRHRAGQVPDHGRPHRRRGRACRVRSDPPSPRARARRPRSTSPTPHCRCSRCTRAASSSARAESTRGAAIPSVLELVADGRLHPELVTSAVVAWDDAAETLAHLEAKTVVTRAATA